MSAPSGWYPDPGGEPGAYRYWDGQRWSAQTSHDPRTPPPGPAAAHPASPRPRNGRAWLLGGLAVLVGLVLLGVFVVRQVQNSATRPGPGLGSATSQICPTPSPVGPSATTPNDDRVYGGRLSYPRLGRPWDPPQPDNRVPFGRDVVEQFAVIETGDFLGFRYWGANLLIGELLAGDGFFQPEDGAEIVLRCVSGTFYGETEVTREDRRSEAITVDGRSGWIVETDLGFDVPNLEARNELLIVVIIDIGDGTAGLFLASAPENGPQFVPQVRQALAELRVED